ncbi:MAG: LysM peptidoglycan-binding domain-containing protein [Oscillibacter sp.]|nr:LysM peptidoglycan-binding domain-containing protein [Oscillibacter sp.]
MEELQRPTGQTLNLCFNTCSAQTIWSSDLAAYPLWVAQYNGVWDSWSDYQYTSSGWVAGISGNVDLDWFTTRLFTATPLPPASGGTNVHTYTVRAGDTLRGIAQTYGTTVAALAAANGIADPDLIYPGEILQIPGTEGAESGAGNTTGTYTVRSGDTLWGIAQIYGTTVAALTAANDFSVPPLIYPGEVLLIPGTGGAGNQAVSTYTVRAGNTLWGIPQNYGTTVGRWPPPMTSRIRLSSTWGR